MARGARRRAVTADIGVRSQSCLYGICGIHCGTVTVFSSTALVFRCQYYSTHAPHSYFIHLHRSYTGWRKSRLGLGAACLNSTDSV